MVEIPAEVQPQLLANTLPLRRNVRFCGLGAEAAQSIGMFLVTDGKRQTLIADRLELDVQSRGRDVAKKRSEPQAIFQSACREVWKEQLRGIQDQLQVTHAGQDRHRAHLMIGKARMMGRHTERRGVALCLNERGKNTLPDHLADSCAVRFGRIWSNQ
ncbi:hypothetical protein D3C71_1566000 [compost metagenome]